MPNSEWIKRGADAMIRVECDSTVMTAGDNCGEVYIKHPWGARWFPAHALLPLPSPTDAAITEARDRVVEAADRYEHICAMGSGAGMGERDRICAQLYAAVRDLRALTARPKPPLEVALEAALAALRRIDAASYACTDRQMWMPMQAEARAAILLLEREIKGEG